jgi:hypothetical protein
MAALAVAAATELRRWQPTQDFAISGGRMVLTSAGKARCSDGKCWNTQALLDFQDDRAGAVVKFPGGVRLSPAALRSRLAAKLEEQKVCDSRPDNRRGDNCPAEEHQLTFKYSKAGSCDTNFFFEAKAPNGAPLEYPGQLKNKLIWADHTNPYIAFQNVGEMVSIDPTFGLNEKGSTSTGSCTAACVRVSASNLAGQCCSCGNANKAFAKSPFSSLVYICQ